jgi:tetratricopeptide (TPR) repeat protein
MDEATLLERRGDLAQALELFEESRRIADAIQDPELISRTVCNVSTVHLLSGNIPAAERGLREILLQTRTPRIVFGASHNLACALRRQGNLPKALFYARKAMRAAEAMDNIPWKATCRNLLGNIYRDMSYPDDAMREYQEGLRLGQEAGVGTSFEIDYVRENLGYCLLLKKKYHQGIAIILESMQIAQGNENARCVVECCQDLCFGYMQLKELERARKYGDRALAMATEKGYNDIAKNCYYLLGEIHLLQGEDDKSDYYFGKLQELYPKLAVLRQFLRTFDVSNIINLKNTF